MSGAGEKLRVALVGCGRIGAHTREHLRETMPPGWCPLSHAEAICSHPGLELVAVCDSSEEQARKTAEKYGVPQWFASYEALIAEVRPDILSIATRTEGRCEIIRTAAENGVKGIHAEKPLGRSLEECRGAIRAVEENGVHLTFGATRRFMGLFRTARESLLRGEIGDLRQVSVDLGHTTLLWNHPHSFDALVFLSGCDEIEYIQAACEIDPAAVQGGIVDADPVLDFAFVKFANGVNGLVTSGSGLNFRAAGTNGSLTIAGDGSWIDRCVRASEDVAYQTREKRIMPEKSESGTQRVFGELAEAIASGAPLSISTKEIELNAILIFGAVYSALNGGRRVIPGEIPDSLVVTGRQGDLYA